MPKNVRVIESKRIYQGKVATLCVDRIVEPGGVEATREIVSHAGSAVVLPRLPDGRILLVRQFRYAAGKMLWELVAGGIEPGEDPEQGAYRELLEETGYRAGSMRFLCSFYPSPGFLSEQMFLFEATDLARSKSRREADERIRLGRFSPAELRRMAAENRIKDGKTLVGLLWVSDRGVRISSRSSPRRKARTTVSHLLSIV